MVGHQNKFVQKISIAAVQEQCFEKKACPRLRMEKRATLPRVGRDEVGLRIVRCMLACGFQNLPSGAKAQLFVAPLWHD
jgi:hypothetical protein